MGWSLAIGVLALLALGIIAWWGMSGDSFKFPLLRRKAAPPPSERKEPVFNAASAMEKQQKLDLEYTPPQLPPLEEHWQAVYCYVVQFFQEQVQTPAGFVPLKDRLNQRSFSVFQLLGFNENSQQWEAAQTPATYRFWQLMVPLANRGGSLSSERIKLIREDCLRFAEKTNLRVKFPPLEGAMERAKLLDQFCNEVDVVLNLRVVLNDAQTLEDTEELLARSYLNKENDSYVYRLDSEKLFTAMPLLLPNNLVREVLFTLDAPRVSQPQRAFEDMIRAMHDMAELKQGQLYDRKDTRLGETDIGIIRGAIDQLATQMSEKGVVPGSTLAHLLFS